MPWHIISIGDEAYLFKIFQFLAMLNSPGTSLYGRLGMLGALIGLMLVLFQIVSSAGRNFSFGSLMIGIVMFTVLFGTSTNVELEDFHTGRTDIVDGVPLGTAIVGTLVSQGGAALIDLFQQGTAVPGEEVMPSDYALRALSATYTLSSMPGCGNNAALCPLTKTLRAYWSNCAYPQSLGLGTGTTGWANGDPTTSPDALKAIASSNRFTVTSDWIHDSTGTVSSQTCADTYADIQKFFSTTAGTDSFACQYLAAAGQAVPNNASPGACTAQAESLLQNSFNGLQSGIDTSGGQTELGLGSAIQSAQGSNLLALQNLVIASAAHDAQASGGKGTASDIANASMVESAAQQRDIRYAAEESMFGRTLNATIAFFEGIIYGLAPFMAFLVPLGAIGIKYLGQYLKLLVWLFLWLPLLSFVNLYEIMATMRQMNALQPTLNGAPLYSMVGIMQVQNSAADWIALGGWFTTSIIGLSGMIVFGSVAAFQSIAQAAHGPDAVDSSSIAPELAASVPAIQRGADYSSSGGSALSKTGLQSMSFSNQGLRSSALQFQESKIVQEARRLGFTGSVTQGHGVQAVQNWMQTASAGHGTQTTLHNDESKAVGHGVQTSTQISDASAAEGGGQVGVGVKVLGTGATLGAGVKTNVGVQDSAARDASARETNTQGVTENKSISGGVNTTQGSGGANTVTSGSSQAWSAGFDKLAGDVQKYNSMVQESSSSSATVTATAGNVADGLTSTEAGRAELSRLDGVVNDLGAGARGYQQQLADQLVAKDLYQPEQAHAVATMATLQRFADDNSLGDNRMLAVEALSEGLRSVNPTFDAVSSMNSGGFAAGAASERAVASEAGSGVAQADRTIAGGHFNETPGSVGGAGLWRQSTDVRNVANDVDAPGAGGKAGDQFYSGMTPVFESTSARDQSNVYLHSEALSRVTGDINSVENGLGVTAAKQVYAKGSHLFEKGEKIMSDGMHALEEPSGSNAPSTPPGSR